MFPYQGFVEQWRFDCYWNKQESKGIEVVGHRIVFYCQKLEQFFTARNINNEITGIRYRIQIDEGSEIEILNLKPHEFQFQSTYVFGNVRFIRSVNEKKVALVVDAKLSEMGRQLETKDRQNILTNCTKVLMNSVSGDDIFIQTIDFRGDSKFEFDLNNHALLQPNAIFEGRSKLHHSLGRTDLADEIQSTRLINKKQETYIDVWCAMV
jgi:hypothetical protein